MSLLITLGVPAVGAAVVLFALHSDAVDWLNFDTQGDVSNQHAKEKCIGVVEEKFDGSFQQRRDADESPDKVMHYNLNGDQHRFFAKVVPIRRPGEHKKFYPLVVWNRTDDELFDFVPDVSKRFYQGHASLFQHPAVKDKLESQGYKTESSGGGRGPETEIHVAGNREGGEIE